MTTPAAAPAAPAAAPAAPAPAPAPAPAAPAAAPAPAPAPVPAAPAAPAADTADSLISDAPAAPAAAPQTDAEKLAAAKALVAAAEAAADPNGGKSWLLHEGVMGQGERPTWFKADKYKTVAEQARAYSELEPRFGAFKGAPKNAEGQIEYKFQPPEGVEFSRDHPMAKAFFDWAGKNQLSQEGADQLLGQLIQYEMAQEEAQKPNLASLGDKAQDRIAAVAAWGKANLGAEGFATLKEATKGKYAPEVIKLLEVIIPQTAQFRMPKPGAENVPAPAGGQAGLEAIQAKLGEKLPDGRRRADVEPAFRAAVEKELREYFEGAPTGTQYRGSHGPAQGWQRN